MLFKHHEVFSYLQNVNTWMFLYVQKNITPGETHIQFTAASLFCFRSLFLLQLAILS